MTRKVLIYRNIKTGSPLLRFISTWIKGALLLGLVQLAPHGLFAIDTSSPVVTSLTINGSSSLETISGTAFVEATATDNVWVDRVEFYLDDTKSPPIEVQYGGYGYNYFNWDTAPVSDGTHTLFAVAFDTTSNRGTGQIDVIIDNADTTPPVINYVYGIDNGDTVSEEVDISGNASDTGGINPDIDHIEYWLNGSLLHSEEGSGYGYGSYDFYYTWNSSPTLYQGGALFEIVAYDLVGLNTTAEFTVTIDNRDLVAPTVNITSPQDGGTVQDEYEIYADVSDGGGAYAGLDYVDFQLNSVSVYTVTDPDGYYYFSYSTSAAHRAHNSQLQIAAYAADKSGNVSSDTVHVTVNNPNDQPPSISIVTPKDRQTVWGEVAFSANASDDIGVDRVQFFIDGVIRSTDTISPYNFSWDTTAEYNMIHTLMAKAIDGAGQTDQRTIYVTVDNPDLTPPAAAIIFPADGANVSGLTTIIVNATDDISVAYVEFFADGEYLGTDRTVPFVYVWDTILLDRRDYELSAKAYDAAGNTGTASPVTVSVMEQALSKGTIVPDPEENAFVGDPVFPSIQARFLGAVPDIALLTPEVLKETLQVYATKDGVRSRLSGEVSYNGEYLSFHGAVPDNCRIDWKVSIMDTDGRLMQGLFQFTRPMFKSKGGRAASEDGRFTLDIPPGSLPIDGFVTITPLPSETHTIDVFSTEVSFQPLSDPYVIAGAGAGGQPIEDLNIPATLTYTDSDDPTIENKNRVLQILFEDETGRWRPLQAPPSSVSALDDSAGQTVTRSMARFTKVQAIAYTNLDAGLNDFFNFPNPFSPTAGGTRFHYFLDRESAVDIAVYDLFGSLVKKLSFPAGSIGGQMGQNVIPWDGRNGRGIPIANGGYIVHIASEDSQGNRSRSKTKMLVIK